MRRSQSCYLSLLVLLMLVCSATCKYRHNVGVTDWSSRNIGQIKNAIIDKSRIYFQGVNGIFGYMDKATGEIEVNSGIVEKRQTSWRSQESDHNEKLLAQDEQGLFLHNFLKNIATPISPFSLDKGQLIDHLVISSELYIVATTHSLFSIQKTQITPLLTLQDGWSVSKLSKGKKSTVNVVIQSENKVCAHNWTQETLLKLNNELSVQDIDFVCLDRSESGDKTKIHLSSDLLVYGTKAVILKERSIIELPIAADRIYLCPKTGVLALVRANKAFFNIIENGALVEVYKFEETGLFEFSFDRQSGTPNTLFFIASFKGVNTLYAINVSAKQTTIVIKFSPKYAESSPLQFWVKQKETQELLIQDNDLRTYFVVASQVISETEAGSGETWSREDGLASLDGLIMVDYNQVQNKKINPYYESLDKHGVYNPVTVLGNLAKRLYEEVQSSAKYLKESYSSLTVLFQQLTKIRSKEDLSQLNKLLNPSSEYDITYGLKKVVVAVNKNRTIFSIDSKTGEILWKSSFISRYVTPDFNFHGFFQIENRNGATITEETLLIYHSPVSTKLFIFTVQPLTGELGYVAKFLMKSVKKVFKINIQTDKVQQAIAVIDQDFNVFGYPQSVPNPLVEDKHDNIFYMFDTQSNSLNGYRYLSGKFVTIWNYHLAPEEVLVDIQSPSNEGTHPKIAIFDDTKVILKHIDYSNIAVLSKRSTAERLQGNGMLSLRIFNCKSGRMIYSASESGVDLKQPINLVYDENGIFVSYFHPAHSLFQIWTVELFSNRMENSYVTMLQNYYFTADQHSRYEHFNYLNEDFDVISLEQKYGYSLGIKHMSTVSTKLSLTKRNLVIITPNNQIHSLDRDFLSTRRAVKTQGTENTPIQSAFSFESTTLPPYSYLLPIDKTAIISYYKSLNDLKEIKFQGSNLESTIIFIAYGNDVFMSSIAPDKTFDMINEDFDYVSVIISIIVAIVGVIITRKYAVKAVLNKLFENKENITTM